MKIPILIVPNFIIPFIAHHILKVFSDSLKIN